MIKGIGIDIIEISRIDDSIKRFGKSFIDRIYTAEEQRRCDARTDKRFYYAGRWAAKEAVSKALGCGIGKNCSWLDIEIFNSPTGSPSVFLSGAAAEKLAECGASKLHVSISHERTNAVAMAVIED